MLCVCAIISIMYTRRYFLFALTLPMAVLLGVVIMADSIAAITLANIGTLIVPYLSFCAVMLAWSSRRSPGSIRSGAYRAPIIFLGFQVGYLGVEYAAGVSMAKDIVGLGGIMVIVSIYIVLLGYLYTFIMEQGYLSYLYQKRHQPSARSRMQC